MSLKSILYTIILSFAIAALVSCTDWLTEKPKTLLSPGQVYASPESADAAVIGCYARFSTNPTQNYMYEGLNNCSGIMSPIPPGLTEDHQIGWQLRWKSNSGSWRTCWTHIYEAVGKCNDVIYNLETSELPQEIIEQYSGEVRFLRANLYFLLVRMYGRIPLVTVPPKTLEEVYAPRAKVNIVYKQILDDLDYAEMYMRGPGRTPQRKGRPNYWAATALKGKVYAQIGDILDNLARDAAEPGSGGPFTNEGPYPDFDLSGGSEFANCGIQNRTDAWTLAYEINKNVYDNGPYELVPNYANLFYWKDPAGEFVNGVESIFDLQNTEKSTANFCNYRTTPTTWAEIPNLSGTQTEGRIRPHGWAFLYFRDKYTSTIEGRTYTDPRIDISFVHSRYTYNAFGVNPGASVTIFPTVWIANRHRFAPYLRKFVDENRTTNASNANMHFMRFGEVVLTLAEAAAELDKTQESLGYINELMYRARHSSLNLRGTNTVPKESPVPADWKVEDFADSRALVDAIVMERCFELMGEALDGWFNVRRKGAKWFKQYISGPFNRFMWDDPDSPAVINGYNVIMPNDTYRWPETYSDIRRIMLQPIPNEETDNNPNIPAEDNNDY